MSSIINLPGLFQVLNKDNTTGANNIIFSDGTNYLGFGTTRSTDGYVRVGKSFSIHGLNASNANITLLDLVSSQIQIGSSASAGIALNGGTSTVTLTNAATGTLATFQTSTLSGHTDGSELVGNGNSLTISSNKLFFNVTNPDLGGVLAVGFSGNDPETTPAFLWGNGFVRVYDQSGSGNSLNFDVSHGIIGYDGVSSGTTKTLIVRGQGTTGTSGTDGYAGNLIVVAGSSAGASGTRVGGDITISPGSGVTANGAAQITTGGGTVRFKVNDTGMGFFAATPVAKPTVTGSKGGNAALGSLLTALANLGLVTDSTS
jgi:hypothetical protein